MAFSPELIAGKNWNEHAEQFFNEVLKLFKLIILDITVDSPPGIINASVVFKSDKFLTKIF